MEDAANVLDAVGRSDLAVTVRANDARIADLSHSVVAAIERAIAAEAELAECQSKYGAAVLSCEVLARERDATKARLDAIAPHVCPECGPNTRVDEEGCCALCGADTCFAFRPDAPL
jgi:hypothetical protein